MSTTLTLCIPSSTIGSIVCRSQQQASHIAHQISRAAVLYGASEIVIYDVGKGEEDDNEGVNNGDGQLADKPKKVVFGDLDEKSGDKKEDDKSGPSEESIRLASLLQYYITPSYLRKSLFPNLGPLQYAKKLPKIPGLPFLNHKTGKFLEGLTVKSKSLDGGIKKKGSRKSKKQLQLESLTEYVQIGEQNVLKLTDQKVPLGTRVTVDVENKKVVSPKDAYVNNNGVLFTNKDSFGYTVRIASSFGKIFSESIHAGGYTFTVYIPSEEFTNSSNESYQEIRPIVDKKTTISNTKHSLLIYGKWKDVNSSVINDTEELKELTDASGIFDGRFNIRGSGRTEDAVLISLAQLE